MDTSASLAGLRDVAPAVPAVVPVGMLFGAIAVQTGFTPLSATALSLFAFAGAAQLAAVELLREGATLQVVLATILLINLRYVIFSASLAPKVRHLSKPWRAVVAYPLFDLNYALAETRFAAVDSREDHRGWYLLGVSLPLVAAFVTGTLAGTHMGRVVGDGLGIDFAITLVFVSLLALQIEDRSTALAAVGAVIVAVAGADLSVNLGLLAAVFCGTVVGVLSEARLAGRSR